MQSAVTAGDRLLAVVDAVVGVDLDPLTDGEVRELLGRTQRAVDRLVALRSRAQATLETRALQAAGPGREHQALRLVRDRTADELRLTPSQVKQAGDTGRRMEALPTAAAAMADGQLPADHARVLADTLRWLEGDARTEAEATLVEAARTEDARRFGRTCRRLLAQADTEAAQTAQDRRNARRRLAVTDTPDGMTLVSGQLAGLGGEVVQTTLNAFRRPDPPGRRRTAAQATADALVEICRVALDAGKAPSNRGVRPHVLITVDEPTVADRAGTGAGVCEAAWTGPLPWPEARRLLSDASVSRVLLDPAGAPTRAGIGVRTVPAGLWKALQVRDRTCAGDGCTVPAGWCQVMHLVLPYRLDGQLDIDTAAPGCDYHHRMLDRHGWQVTWMDGRPVVHHPDRPPRTDPGGPAP